MHIRTLAKSTSILSISLLPLFATSFILQHRPKYQYHCLSSSHNNRDRVSSLITNNNNNNNILKMSSAEETSKTTPLPLPDKDDIPTFHTANSAAAATDFANYFCAYAQLYHQKQMLTDHNRMAAYHAAIVGNSDVFKDKVVMDVGTGSGILAGELRSRSFVGIYYVM